jgi:hypothetical protein
MKHLIGQPKELYYRGLKVSIHHKYFIEVEFIVPRAKPLTLEFKNLWQARKAILAWAKQSPWNEAFARGSF